MGPSLARRVEDDRSKYFCSEAVSAALGFADGWRFDPNTFYPSLVLANEAAKKNKQGVTHTLAGMGFLHGFGRLPFSCHEYCW